MYIYIYIYIYIHTLITYSHLLVLHPQGLKLRIPINSAEPIVVQLLCYRPDRSITSWMLGTGRPCVLDIYICSI